MKSVLKYNIDTGDGQVYECMLELVPVGFLKDEYDIHVLTPPNERDFHELYLETLVEVEGQWQFKRRGLPQAILNLERFLHPYVVEMRN